MKTLYIYCIRIYLTCTNGTVLLSHCIIKLICIIITSNTIMEDRCPGIAIRKLCNIRDGIDDLPFAINCKAVIESMCIN